MVLQQGDRGRCLLPQQCMAAHFLVGSGPPTRPSLGCLITSDNRVARSYIAPAMTGGDQRALALCLAAAAGAAALLAAQQLAKLVSGRGHRSATPTDGSKLAAARADGASLFAAGCAAISLRFGGCGQQLTCISVLLTTVSPLPMPAGRRILGGGRR